MKYPHYAKHLSEFDETTLSVDGPFHVILRNEALWWPYRSVSRAMYQLQRNRASMLAIHRKMTAEAAAIFQLENETMSRLSAAVIDRATPDDDSWDEAQKRFDHAIVCVRELGEAVIKMQVDALEAMRDIPRTRHAANPRASLPKQKVKAHSHNARAHAPKDKVVQ